MKDIAFFLLRKMAKDEQAFSGEDIFRLEVHETLPKKSNWLWRQSTRGALAQSCQNRRSIRCEL